MEYIENGPIQIKQNMFMECLHESDTYYNGSNDRKLYIDNQIPRLYRIFKNIVLAKKKIKGPTLDAASGWGIFYPVLKKYLKELLPYCIAELANWDEVSIDNEKIEGCKFECENDILKYKDNTFGLVCFFDCLEHLIVDPVWTFLEFNRVLKKGGHIIVNTPNVAAAHRIIRILNGDSPATESEFKPCSIYQRHNREWTPAEVRQVLECCGFSNCNYSTSHHLFGENEKKNPPICLRIEFIKRTFALLWA